MTFKIHRVYCPTCSKMMKPMYETYGNVVAFFGMRCPICSRDSFVRVPPLLFKNGKFRALGGNKYEIVTPVVTNK